MTCSCSIILCWLVWTGGDIIDFGRYLHISINTQPGLLLCDSSHVCAYYSAGPAVPSSYLCYDIPSDCLSRPDLCFDPQSRPPSAELLLASLSRTGEEAARIILPGKHLS